ncbi:MAG: hypothetical protein V3V55_05375 [Rhodospirillales bacterium]
MDETAPRREEGKARGATPAKISVADSTQSPLRAKSVLRAKVRAKSKVRAKHWRDREFSLGGNLSQCVCFSKFSFGRFSLSQYNTAIKSAKIIHSAIKDAKA